jgi:hypothetical protein
MFKQIPEPPWPGSMLDDGDNWVCPYCGFAQVLSDDRIDIGWQKIEVSHAAQGSIGLHREAIVCANDHCKQLSLRYAGRQRHSQKS